MRSPFRKLKDIERGAALAEYASGVAILALGFLTAYPKMDATINSLDTNLQTNATQNNGYTYMKPLIPAESGGSSITDLHMTWSFVHPGTGDSTNGVVRNFGPGGNRTFGTDIDGGMGHVNAPLVGP